MKGKSLISVIGAGSHGTLLALLISQTTKYHVKLIDKNEETLSRSHIFMENLLAQRISKGKIDHQDYYSILENISVSTNLNAVKSSDFILECVNENLPLKLGLISILDNIIDKNCILLSTTTSFSITKLASASNTPSRVAGFHTFALPISSNVVEVVYTGQSSQESINGASDLAKALGKEWILVKDTPGFIANKVIFSFINEAIDSYSKGFSTKEEIDKSLKLVTGMNLGPFEMADEIGLDIILENLQNYYKVLGEVKYAPSYLLISHVNAGWTGRKVGRGFYNYS